MALEPAKLSDFQVAGALGSGTTARVYEAVHTATGRPVAIKVMESSQPTSEMRERFAREALLLSGLESRYVTKILGFGFEKGQPFLVLERLNGETLDAKLRRDGPVPPPIAVRWIEQLIAGVRDCHDAKIIHRDIKPSNIFLHQGRGYGRDGAWDGAEQTVKLIDFGVARLREIAGEVGGLTSTNHLIGSMGYMAPEQFQSAKTVGYSADLYALGVVIFRTLTGRLPFVSRSVEAVIRMKSEQAPPTISSMGPVQNSLLDWFVQKALMRDPETRFQSAREMLEHWWAVVSSLDDEAATDVMGGARAVGRSFGGTYVAESPPLEAAGPPATIPDAKPITQRAVSRPVDVDERNNPRPMRAPIALPSAASSPPASRTIVSPPASRTIISPPQSSDRTLREQEAPRTVPSEMLVADETAAAPARIVIGDMDPCDLPTRNDPNLRKLVERELELQKARKRGG